MFHCCRVADRLLFVTGDREKPGAGPYPMDSVAMKAQVPGVADGGGCQRPAVEPVAAGQFLGKMHGVAHRAAVATGEYAAVCGESVDQALTGGGDVRQRLLVGEQGVQRLLGFKQAGFDDGGH